MSGSGIVRSVIWRLRSVDCGGSGGALASAASGRPMRTRSPRDKHPAPVKVRPFRRNPTRVSGCRTASTPDHLAPRNAAVRGPARVMGADGGQHERHPGSVCKPHPDAARQASRSGCGPWRRLPCPDPGRPPAGCRRLASVWRGLGRASCAASPASPRTKRLRFGRHRGRCAPAPLPSSGHAAPALPGPGRPHPRQGAGHPAGGHLGQQEPGPCPTPRSRPPTASAAR
jgi:hypothetical protein